MHALSLATRLIGRLLLLSALPLAAPAADILTVNNSGPSDHNKLQVAVNKANPGDVIVIYPGFYDPPDMIIDKDLTITSPTGGSKPHLDNARFDVVGSASFTLSGVQRFSVYLNQCTGRVRIEDCESVTHLQAYSSREVIVTGSHIQSGGEAVTISQSSVVLAGCDIQGGKYDSANGDEGIGIFGPPAVLEVTVAGSNVSGGDCDSFWGDFAGHGIEAEGAAAPKTSVRGSSFHLVEGGSCGGGGASALSGAIAYSGVTVESSLPPAEVTLPYLDVPEPATLGQPWTVDAYGSAGAPLVLLASTGIFHPAPIHGWGGGRLWVDPSELVFTAGLSLAGQDTPASATLTVPDLDALTGVAVDFQGISLLDGGAFYLTNPTQLIVRRP